MATTETQREQMVADSKRFAEGIWNEKDFAVVDELMAADCVTHTGFEELTGPEEYKAWVRDVKEAFPDFEAEALETFVGDDTVTMRYRISGTHEGTSKRFDLEPTGKHFSVEGIAIDRYEDGKLVEGWVQDDMLGMLQQLGVVPEM